MRDRTLLVIGGLIICCVVTVQVGAQPQRAVPENTAVVDPRVLIKLCVDSGSITVRGWDRNEVRTRPTDGIHLAIQGSTENDLTAQRNLLLLNSKTGGNCIESGDIELDVPHEAGIDLRSGSARVKVSGIATLKIINQDGSIDIEQASQSIDINSIASHISVRDSRGSIKLRSASGSIQVQHVNRNAAGEVCEVTSLRGDITLDGVDHKIVEASTMNGALNFSGPLVWAGRYHFQTILGDIKLSLPPDSSFRIGATLARGTSISSDFALQSASTPVTSTKILGKSERNLRYLYAAHGTADIFITIATFSGHIYFTKK